MGGKNCVIVDSDADLDEAVPAIVSSAFVYAGQKCSAASRVLAHEAIADTLIERLAGAVEVLRVGQADDFATEVPAGDRARGAGAGGALRRAGRAEGKVAARAATVARTRAGSAPPTLVADLPPDSPVLRDEIFGPLLAVSGCRHRRRLRRASTRSPFALTGGLFSRSPRDGRAGRHAARPWATST